MRLKLFSKASLDDLVAQAINSPRLRQHANIHQSYSESCQRLMNAIEPGSYVRPHSHAYGQGAETIFALRGLMALFCFDEIGNVDQINLFGSGKHLLKDNVLLGVEIPSGVCHTVVSLESGSVLLEVKGGPFDPNIPKFPAVWAPEEGSEASAKYLASLKLLVPT